MQTAWQDSFVVNPVWDSSLTYSITQYQYPLPATVTTVREIYFERASDQYPELISPSTYEVVNGIIQFNREIQNYLNDTYTLFIKGWYKLATTDSLQTDAQINYVLSLAAYVLLRQLMLKHVFVFLRNDTSTGDIKAARDDMRADMLMYKQRLRRDFEST